MIMNHMVNMINNEIYTELVEAFKLFNIVNPNQILFIRNPE